MKVRSLCAGQRLSNTDIVFKSNKCCDDGLLRSQLVVCLAGYVCRDSRLVVVAVHFAARPKVSLNFSQRNSRNSLGWKMQAICSTSLFFKVKSDLGHFVLCVSLTCMIPVKHYITSPDLINIKTQAKLRIGSSRATRCSASHGW